MPTDLDDYLFDLRGYLILKNAVDADLLHRLNAGVDAIPPTQPGEWWGHVENQVQHPRIGVNLQQIIEAGEPFEELIDHPSWLDHLRRYVGADGLFIDENFVNLRGPNEAINIHSGGDRRMIRSQFRFHNNKFRCGQINILLALGDVGPGDGATVIVPGSHKSNLPHPVLAGKYEDVMGTSAEGVEGSIEVYLQAGDALLFVDAICHGSAARLNSGQRRIVIYRYGPFWGNNRFGYVPSDELLSRLTPERRKIIQPIAFRRPPR
jgi:hypothetical protein